VKELLKAGVNVAIGHDSVMDPWYPLGYGDPLQAAFMLAHYGHMSGATELPYLLEMITTNPAKALGVDSAGVRVGGPASLVVFDAPTAEDALRRISPRYLVMRDGEVLSRTAPSQTTVTINGTSREVNFLRP
jgi:cytosine deaminase